MTKSFRDMFADMIEFHSLEGTFDCKDPAPPGFLTKGFKPPFKAWIRELDDQKLRDKHQVEGILFEGVEESTERIA